MFADHVIHRRPKNRGTIVVGRHAPGAARGGDCRQHTPRHLERYDERTSLVLEIALKMREV